MCGILAIIGKGVDVQQAKELSSRMNHRGPNEHDIHVTENGHILSHERLSIIDLHTGKQPIQGCDTVYMIHNGEIYNHQKLRDTVLKEHVFRTKSDSEVIVHLYEEFGYNFLDKLDGVFSFVVIDGDDFIAARGPIGVKPLYYGKDKEDRLYFSSEMEMASITYPHNTPTTKEAFYIRRIFAKHFPQEKAAKTVLKWIPKWQENTDPSGRANKNHVKANVHISKVKLLG